MKLSANIYGAAFMTISLFSFVSNDALMKYLFKIISVEQGIFIRGLISVPLLVTIAIARKDFFVTITRHNWKIIIIRAFAEMGATIAFLTALSKMPLANVTAILQSLPLTVTMF